jgi:membrane-associated protease RseP (regulator of RpoE activity)
VPLPPAEADPLPFERLAPDRFEPDPYGRGWVFVPLPRPSAWRRWGINLTLFVATLVSVFLVGGLKGEWPALEIDIGDGTRQVLGIMSILLAHEMGHYLACRFYGVDASLPYFLPFPISLVGTLGAFIRIRAPIPHRKALFDIGIAGPLAGFFVSVPVLVFGVFEAQARPAVPSPGAIYLGEPLLFQWAVALLRGSVPEGMTLHIGPLGLAAWFGLFVTALNMLPIGQLDGGHVTYAMLRERAALVSRLGSWVCVLLIYFGPNWLVWSLLLRLLGRRHPPTRNDHAPLGKLRVAIGIFGFVVFAVCFVPDPLQGSWREFFQAVRELLRDGV